MVPAELADRLHQRHETAAALREFVSALDGEPAADEDAGFLAIGTQLALEELKRGGA